MMNNRAQYKSLRGRIKRIANSLAFPHVSDYLSEFIQTDFYSRERIEKYQLQKLSKLLNFAYEHVPYYHRIFTELKIKPNDIRRIEDLTKLPVLTKEIIWQEGNNMYADIPLDGVKVGSTSGSTGKSLVLYKTKTAREIEQALVTRYMRNGGIDETEYALLLWGGKETSKLKIYRNKFKAWLMNETHFNCYDLSPRNIDAIIEVLQSGKVHYLRGYVSAIFFLAQIMNERNIHIVVPFVSLTAEQLYDFQRAEIEKAMGKNIYNQYGCGECGALAMECNAHEGLHHAFEHSILEIVDDNNHPAITGKVVLTNLDNYAMPLIRYENGDMLTLSKKECTCGRHSQLIAHIDGRRYDMIEGESGHYAHGGFFDDCFLKVDLLNKYSIRQMRIVQKEQTMFCFQYVADKEIVEEDKVQLQDEYRMMLGKSVRLLFEKKKEIQSAKSGKRHFVIPLQSYLLHPDWY